MEKNKLDNLSEKLFKINLDLDTLRTNINVSLFYINELMRDAKNKKDDKEVNERIKHVTENYDEMNFDGVIALIKDIEKQTLLIGIERKQKK